MSSAYRDLRAWQESLDLVTEIYKSTQSFPKEELYGLTAQLRRAAVSVSSNTAEGKGRYSDKDSVHFLRQPQGPLFEIETQLVTAHRLGYVAQNELNALCERAGEIDKLGERPDLRAVCQTVDQRTGSVRR